MTLLFQSPPWETCSFNCLSLGTSNTVIFAGTDEGRGDTWFPALCVSGQTVVQHVNGIQASRASMIISVLAKEAGLKLQENVIFLNVVSGVTLKETAGDLAIAAAICSSFLESPIPNSTAFIGEIGLCGELRPVSAMDKRIHTLAKLGYKTGIVPKSAEKSVIGTPGFENIKIIGCKNLKEVINSVFRSN